jgi:hypothetical protein
VADNAKLSVSLDGFTKDVTATLAAAAKKVVIDVTLAAAAADVAIALGNLTTPKFLLVMSDDGLAVKGVSFKLAVGGSVVRCNPFAAIIDLDGFAQTQILLSNSDANSHKVTVIAAE